MTILIISQRGDLHALTVEYCLQKAGAAVTFLNCDELVSRAALSLKMDSRAHAWRYWNGEVAVDFDEVTTVWNRRFGRPELPADELHPDDFEIADREAREYSVSLVHAIAQQAWWVNPVEIMPRSGSKLAQLLQANQAGMPIPETLVSNNPAEIRSFLADPRPAIYKAMTQMAWNEDGKAHKLATACVDSGDLPPDRMLQLVPGIYQRRVIKRSDIRTIFLGDQHTSIRIPVKDNPAGAVDVRVTPLTSMKAEPFELPDDVARACRCMMRAFDLAFACFDFVESTSGALEFLEINPAGQFLWMEHVVPETRLLQKFLAFISKGQVRDPVTVLDVLDQPDFHSWSRQRLRRTQPAIPADAMI
jgi:hypothetical protein